MRKCVLLIGFLCACLSVAPGAIAKPSDWRSHQHVIGGNTADVDAYPFVVQLQAGLDQQGNLSADGSFSTFCSGSLIAKQWVLTAAHCIRGLGVASKPNGAVKVVFVNSSNQQEILVDRVVVHPGYLEGFMQPGKELFAPDPILNSRDTGTDVALMRLQQEADVPVLRLARTRQEDMAYRNQAVIAGYGYTDDTQSQLPSQLYAAQESLLSDAECGRQRVSHQYGRLANWKTQLCRRITKALSSSVGITCNGDSGGPVMLTDQYGLIQVGVVSWGSSLEGGCWGKEAIDIYSRVAAAYPWITSTLGSASNAGFVSGSPLHKLTLQPRGRLGIEFKGSSIPYQLRWLPMRSIRRTWNGLDWMPLWYLGEDAAFVYTNIRRGNVSTEKAMPRGNWRAGQCLNFFWQTISRGEHYSNTQRGSWLVARRGKELTLKRSSCGYKMA